VTRPGRPTRVMYVVPDLNTGGAERHVTTLLPRLDRTRFEPSAVCIGVEGALFPDLRATGVPAIALNRGKAGAILALADLVTQMRRQRPDVVLVRGYNAELLGRVAAVIARVPHRVVWVHNCGDLESRGRVRRIADRLLNRYTDAYFGVAWAQLPYLVDELGCSRDKVRIIWNGVQVSRFDPADDRTVLAELGVDPGAPVVGILAALRPEKDHVTLLRAMRRVAERFPDVVLLVVGDGPMREEIVRTAAELGVEHRTIMTGSRSDIDRILRALTVFTLCSFTIECFPMALLEAMAAGRPAVCTAVGGMPEMVEDGVTGFLVPPHDPDALADRLVALIEDPELRRRMGAQARRRASESFSLEASVAAAAREIEAVAVGPVVGPAGVVRRDPIRLTVVLDVTFVGGVEILLLMLFQQFDPNVVRPRLVCLREEGPLAADFRAAGFDVQTLDRRGRFDLRTLPRLVRSLREDRTDVVLVPHHHRAALALGRVAAKIARVAANVVMAHDMDMTALGGRVLPKWAVRTLALSDALVLLSDSQGRYLHAEEGVGRRPWESVREVVIPNGIDLPAEQGGEERARARAALGVGPDEFVVGVVGRLSSQKAHEVLFDAVARCLTDVPTLRLVVIGDGPRSGELHALAQQLGIASRTSFLGTRRDVTALLPGLDVSCLSSNHEAVPIALIESMAYGVPVVATDCGAIRDIVEDGEQGFVVPPQDPGTFADRLRLLARDGELRVRLGKSGRARAEREFGIERTARAYEALMTELTTRR
jgi:glycosyltransferase involved in cell wall biosynthesis